jgi:hypothetical protein
VKPANGARTCRSFASVSWIALLSFVLCAGEDVVTIGVDKDFATGTFSANE